MEKGACIRTADPMTIISFCTGMGLMDRAFLDEGFNVIPLCEIDDRMRAMYAALNGREPLYRDLASITDEQLQPYAGMGMVAGPPCQHHSKTRAMRPPKFPDLTPQVQALVDKLQPDWYLFENVAPVKLTSAPGAPPPRYARLDAMHFAKPHQSRPRWFTYWHRDGRLASPTPYYSGTIDDLMAYPAVAARLYGPKRGAVLQGYPRIASLPFPCAQLQLGLANAVQYDLARAWARQVRAALGMVDHVGKSVNCVGNSPERPVDNVRGTSGQPALAGA